MPDFKDARKRSVDNLQRLYTFVVSLALAESLRRTLLSNDIVQLVWSNKWVMFLSLIFTVIPFYHGANRYLDATYVTGERTAKRYSLMVDFLFLFLQGLLLFTLALIITNDPSLITDHDTYFFSGLALLLFIDIIWVLVTTVITEDKRDDGTPSESNYQIWALLNVVAVILIFVLVYYELWTWLLVLTFGRSVLDYLISHNFYYPQNP
jgi:uncharacterized membrane protein